MKTENTNIEHVNSLNAIDKLETLQFEGLDADLATSLFEYGLAWKQIGDEILFVYGIGIDDNGNCNRFDRCSFDCGMDVREEFDWVNFDDILSFTGMNSDEWDKRHLAQKISDLLSYYGFWNVFGSSYWEGFEISEESE